MTLRSGSLQTPATDALGTPNAILDGDVTAMDVLDPTENEKTSLLEVDDAFDVQLTWDLTGVATPVVGGFWIVSLYSDDMDGVGAMTGLIAGPATIPITGMVASRRRTRYPSKFTSSRRSRGRRWARSAGPR